jgi:hypothetical protein
MEFTGRIKKILPLVSGTSQKGEWKKLPFIFEYFENATDRWADTVKLETFDTKVIDNLKEGMEVRCGFGHHAFEYKDTYYNELRLYKIKCIRKPATDVTGTVAAPAAPAVQEPQPQPEEGDDLPF